MKTIAPADCTEEDLYRIKRDNLEVKDFSILTDGFHVWISEQKMGEEQKQNIEIPPKIFKKLAQWYLEPQPMIRP